MEYSENENIWFTKKEWIEKALEYDPSLAGTLAVDPDYVCRGKVLDSNTGKYADYYLACCECDRRLGR